MREYEAMERAGDFEGMPKKEGLRFRRELEKLRRNLGGIRELDRLPDAVFVIDTKKEHIAVTEANKLVMPIVAVVDTNCDPDVITYVIPGNDDAIRSGALMCRVMAEAVIEGRWVAEHRPKPPAPPANAAAAGQRRPPRGPRAPVGSDNSEPPAMPEASTAPETTTGPDTATDAAPATAPTVTTAPETPPAETPPAETASAEPAGSGTTDSTAPTDES
jgi:small subunit ribosomal protein S2